jgi:hypothetical protein
MRRRHIILVLALVAAAAVAVMGPLRGRSVEDALRDIAGSVTTALPGVTTKGPQATNPAQPPPEITVSQPVAHKIIEWD